MFVKPQHYTNQGRHFTLSELNFITALVEDTSSNLPCVNVKRKPFLLYFCPILNDKKAFLVEHKEFWNCNLKTTSLNTE